MNGRQAVPELQIAVTSPAGTRTAVAGGADTVEQCTALELGGLTPSPAQLDQVIAVGAPVHVLIRPRPGDFVFDTEEVDLMVADAAHAVQRGAAGLVIGALTTQGRVDTEACARIAGAARQVHPDVVLAFHRAIDHVDQPWRELPVLADLGVHRLLTSGGAARAIDGLDTLTRFIVAGGPAVVAGGGVSPEDIPALVHAGVAGLHLSAKRRAPATGGQWIPLGAGTASAEEDTHFVTDLELVRAARDALTIS